MSIGCMPLTPIHRLSDSSSQALFIKRDDLLPYSFGGNKARKNILYFREIDQGDYHCIVTYGSSHSNHCRVVANMAAARKLPCYIIAPNEVSEETYNSTMMRLFGAEITFVPVAQVHEVIEAKLARLRAGGENPYFIPGGGHGILGTQAYVDCYEEILAYEKEQGVHFDYVFFASGTGTTQAGLICGQLIHNDTRKIVGISIARRNPRGCDIVLSSVQEYLEKKQVLFSKSDIQEKLYFLDEYVGDGYGKENAAIRNTIGEVMIQYGIPLDSTYTGKAFYGMQQYLQNKRIEGENVLFIHTGGTPLFFDDIRSFFR